MGHGKDSAGAAFEAQQRRGSVFNFAIEYDVCGHRLNFRHGATEVHENFYPVAAEIKHWSAAGEVLFQQPRTRVASLRIELFERIDLQKHGSADFAGFDNGLDAFYYGIKVPVVRNPEFDPVAATRCDHLIAFAHIHGHRLFAEHVLSCFRGRDGLLSMQVNRGGDVNRVDLFIEQKLLPIQIPSLCAKFFGERRREFRLGPVYSDQLARRQITQGGCDPLLRNVTTTNQSPSKLFHSSVRCPKSSDQSRNGFQVASSSRNPSRSSSFTFTSGGRTGPPHNPAMSINVFIVETSYPLRRTRIAKRGITQRFINRSNSSL